MGLDDIEQNRTEQNRIEQNISVEGAYNDHLVQLPSFHGEKQAPGPFPFPERDNSSDP